jgi:asparagine N-glycosylation enzyme membrane subunit Stt3
MKGDKYMKRNEIVLMITMLSVAVFSYIVGLTWQGHFWMTFLVWFGIVEWQLKKRTGKTLSEHVWTKQLWVRVVLSLLMLGSFASLGWHFIWGCGAHCGGG